MSIHKSIHKGIHKSTHKSIHKSQKALNLAVAMDQQGSAAICMDFKR